ncbi:MAG: TetR/AcrR family transcriptional regulator, partial [Syntrophales bacterium]|nr:TetR/AcrR family transcriptional regulator [Syntrophales bacterium]
MSVNKKIERKKILDAVTRKDIIDAVAATLINEGMQGFTMDKVATAAGVAKGTLYTHFKNKDEAIEVTMDSIVEPLIEQLDAIVTSNIPPSHKLTRYSALSFTFFDDNRDLFRVILYDRGQAHAPKQRFHDSRYWSFVQKLANIFEEGVREGDFLPLPALKVAAMFIDANLSVVMQRLANKITGNIQEDVSLVTGV